MADVLTTDLGVACERADSGVPVLLGTGVNRALRAGCAQDSLAITQSGEDALAWPEFGNEADKDLKW